MDPNVNLSKQLALAARILSGTLAPYDVREDAANLADHVLSLYDWLSKGGSLPDAWRHAGDRPSAQPAPPPPAPPPVYLVVTEHLTYQTTDLRTDSHFLGWVYDGGGRVHRWHEGRCQRMEVYNEPSPRDGGRYHINRWAFRWVDVRSEKV